MTTRLLTALCVLALTACPSGSASGGGGGGATGGGTGGGGAMGGGTGGGSAGGGSGGGATGGGGGAAGGGAGGGTMGTPNPALANLADDTAKDLGAFTCTPVDTNDVCSRVTDYSGFTFDPNHHQFLMFGGGHSTTMTDSVFAFDLENTLTWKELYPPTPCSMMVSSNLDPVAGAWLAGTGGPYPRPLAAHTYDMLDFAPAQNAFVMISRMFNGGYCSQVGNDVGGPVAHFDLGTQTWHFTNEKNAASSTNIDATEYDPMSQKIVLFGRSGLGFYDPATETATWPVQTYNGDTLKDSTGANVDMSALGYGNSMTYFPPTDTFYYFTRGAPVSTWALKLNRASPAQSTLDLVATTGPTSDHGEPVYAYDSHDQVLGGAVLASTFYVFDPATKTWTAHAIQGGSPGDEAFLALGYDPVNNVFIFVTDYNSGAKTWAFRLKN